LLYFNVKNVNVLMYTWCMLCISWNSKRFKDSATYSDFGNVCGTKLLRKRLPPSSGQQ